MHLLSMMHQFLVHIGRYLSQIAGSDLNDQLGLQWWEGSEKLGGTAHISG